MSTTFRTSEPVTLSHASDRTAQCIVDALKSFKRYVEGVDRFTGAFSVDDKNGVRDWSIPAGHGDGGGASYVCTLHVDADADAQRGAVVTAVSNLVQQVEMQDFPRMPEPAPLPKPAIVTPPKAKSAVIPLKVRSEPGHTRIFESEVLTFKAGEHTPKDAIAAALKAFSQYAQGRDLSGAYSVDDGGRVRSWKQRNLIEDFYPVVNLTFAAGASREDVAAALGALAEQFETL